MAAFMERLARNFLALKVPNFSLNSNLKTVQYTLKNCNSVHLLPKQLLCVRCAGNSTRFLRCKSSASNTSVVEHEMPTDVVQSVEAEIQSGLSRLFAVVFIAGQQFKVTTNDLIQLQQHIPADVGERICLQKVLLVGGDNFTLLGRPLLSPEKVRVEATVIEKTNSQKIIVFKMRKRTRFRKYHEKYVNLSVLRINSIEVAPKVS
ncbi:39S ribosomal protein L21, mitochondrial-like isoform X2 [Patiria miniata]|uniref:Large ribosomal subunit protein bL21m n=1 Tax=Patiria miniata TaxID=46514 RepID=A0A914AJ59_PATMI|nr:39S ribosomal protein L21, mitochondrial-like isoform X2 [Patiria miniata]